MTVLQMLEYINKMRQVITSDKEVETLQDATWAIGISVEQTPELRDGEMVTLIAYLDLFSTRCRRLAESGSLHLLPDIGDPIEAAVSLMDAAKCIDEGVLALINLQRDWYVAGNK